MGSPHFGPLWVGCVLVLLLFSGCQSGESHLVAQARQRVLTATEPAAAQQVAAVRTMLLEADDPAAAQPVVARGVIGSMPNPYGREQEADFPWRNGEAVFFLVDPATVAEFAQHPHEKGQECSICLGNARKRSDTVALVQVSGPKGMPIPMRGDKLLGLTEGEEVIVVGQASMVADSMWIDAQQIYRVPLREAVQQ